MNYDQAVDFLNNSFTSFQTSGRAAYKEGLEGITAMCRRLENPQRDYLTIHIAGTNGKGSVAHMLASVLQSAGYCTGLYTSPHLYDFRERIKVDGQPITEAVVARFVSDYGAKMVELGLSYFDMTTAMAFRYFSESDVEVAIIETGLGGRLDSTNIIRPILSIITNVGLDHTNILGNTLPEIASEKAGIIKRGVPVLIGESDPQTDDVFIQQALRSEAKIVFADKFAEIVDHQSGDKLDRYTIQQISSGHSQTIETDLLGDYQKRNVVTAHTAVHMLRHYTKINISTRALMTGFRTVAETTGLRGRWQRISDSPLTIADTGHNAHAMVHIAPQLLRQKYDNLYMVIGFASDKDIDRILSLLPSEAYYIFTQADSPRAMDSKLLEQKAGEYGLKGEASSSVSEAMELARSKATPGDMIFIGGSTFVVAEALKA